MISKTLMQRSLQLQRASALFRGIALPAMRPASVLTSLQSRSFKNPFVLNQLDPRQERQTTMTSTSEIFAHIQKQHQDRRAVSYEDACQLLNDLSFVIIPFDKTHQSFSRLISTIKSSLKNKSGPTRLYELMEGMLRLNLNEANG